MKPTLYSSLRSPFARRVRLILEELGLSYDLVTVDVFNLPLGYYEINPLGRVPAMKTESGEVVVDSWQIQSHLKEQNPAHPLFLLGGASQARARTLSALAVGLMEHTVLAFLETLKGVQSLPAVLDECEEVISRTLLRLEEEVGQPRHSGSFALGATLRVCDLDLGSALAYCELRRGKKSLEPFPGLRSYLAELSARESFKKTVPPA